jgi:hypothetical protein
VSWPSGPRISTSQLGVKSRWRGGLPRGHRNFPAEDAVENRGRSSASATTSRDGHHLRPSIDREWRSGRGGALSAEAAVDGD